MATPVFDGAREEEITGLLRLDAPNRDGVQLIGDVGKAHLFDGRTGEPLPGAGLGRLHLHPEAAAPGG